VIILVTLVVLAAAAVVVELGAFPSLRKRRLAIAASLAAIIAADVLAHSIVMHWQVGGPVSDFLAIVLVTLGIAAPPIAALVLVSFTLSRLRKRPPAQASPPSSEAPLSNPDASSSGIGRDTTSAAGPGQEIARSTASSLSRRQVAEAAGSLAVFGATGSLLGWGALRGRYDFQVVEVPVRIPGLPRALDGYVIAQVSDIHTGFHVGERTLDEGLALVRRARADLLVATGDLVDHDPAFTPMVARKLLDVAPRDGVFAILGNHDHYANAGAVLRALRASGITTLVNEGLVLRPGDGGGFALLGVDDLSARRRSHSGPDLDRSLASVPEHLPRILLSHQPWTVDEWPGRVALQLSGHTHGGQINPGVTPAGFVFRYVAGMYSVGGTSLYVNRGFGTVGPPARVGAPPEITRVILVAA
jgi:predicted MPP superfamily phosphohydrolase